MALPLLAHMFRSTVLIELFSTSSSTAHTLAYESKVHVGGGSERLPLNGTSSPRQVHCRGTFPTSKQNNVCTIALMADWAAVALIYQMNTLHDCTNNQLPRRLQATYHDVQNF